MFKAGTAVTHMTHGFGIVVISDDTNASVAFHQHGLLAVPNSTLTDTPFGDVEEPEAPEVTPEERDLLLRRFQSARDYLYEATMSDYSIESINRGQRQLDLAKQNLSDAGIPIPA